VIPFQLLVFLVILIPILNESSFMCAKYN